MAPQKKLTALPSKWLMRFIPIKANEASKKIASGSPNLNRISKKIFLVYKLIPNKKKVI